MIEDYRKLHSEEVGVPGNRTERVVEENLICVERNGGGGCFTEAAHRFGIRVQFLQPRHDLATNQFYERYKCAPYIGGEIFLLGGSSRAESEAMPFYQVSCRCRPRYAVLITPLGANLTAQARGHLQLMGSTLFGDILGSVWQIATLKTSRLRMFGGPGATKYAKTLGWRYAEFGRLAAGDGGGMITHQAIQFSRGLDVITTDQKWPKRLSINSSVGIPSLENVRGPDVQLPLVLGRDDTIRDISIHEKCIAIGNKSRRGEILINEEAAVDMTWRATPVNLWGGIIGDPVDGFLYTPSDPVEEGDISADTYGFQHRKQDGGGSKS